ncbi:MAG: carbohydrate kinase family protein [Chloroflexota bacterium]
MYDVLVLGELNADLILQGDVEPAWAQAEKLLDDASFVLGGSSAIFACGVARLGLRVAFAGVIGDDMVGQFCRAELERAGVDTVGVVVDPDLKTGMTVILQRPDDRAMLTYAGAIAALTPERIDPALLRRARHVHVGSYFLQTALQPGLPELFAEARGHGATTSLDTNWDPSERWAGLEKLLAVTDILLPNEAEACALAGADDWERALELLAARVPTVAVKRGGAGASAVRGGERVDVAAPPVRVVDAVGAGDSFDAGFVCGALAGWPLERTLRLAVACGALSTQAAGGTAAQPTLEEALAFLGAE